MRSTEEYAAILLCTLFCGCIVYICAVNKVAGFALSVMIKLSELITDLKVYNIEIL